MSASFIIHLLQGKALDTIKLLAWSTKDVGKEAYHYAVEGKFIELAFLLIVAREKVLVPITFLRKDGTGLSGSTTLRECLRNQIVSLEYEATNLMGEVEFERSTQVPDKIMIMKSTALLLDVFERAGERIEEYLRVRQPNVCMIPLPSLLFCLLLFCFITHHLQIRYACGFWSHY